MRGRCELLAAAILVAAAATVPAATAGPLGATQITLDGPTLILVGDSGTFEGRLHEDASGFQLPLGHQPVEVRVTCEEDGDAVHGTETATNGTYRVDHAFPATGICTVQAVAWPGTPQATASDPVEVTVGGELTADVRWMVCPAPGHEDSGHCVLTPESNLTVSYEPGTEVDVTAYLRGRLTLDGEGVPDRNVTWDATICHGHEDSTDDNITPMPCGTTLPRNATTRDLGFWSAWRGPYEVTVPETGCRFIDADVDAEYRTLTGHGQGRIDLCAK